MCNDTVIPRHVRQYVRPRPRRRRHRHHYHHHKPSLTLEPWRWPATSGYDRQCQCGCRSPFSHARKRGPLTQLHDTSLQCARLTHPIQRHGPRPTAHKVFREGRAGGRVAAVPVLYYTILYSIKRHDGGLASEPTGHADPLHPVSPH